MFVCKKLEKLWLVFIKFSGNVDNITRNRKPDFGGDGDPCMALGLF